jgi:hypothetical protein
MPEQFTLSAPASKINTKWTIDYITFDFTGKSISIRLKGDNDEYLLHTISSADVLLSGLVKADLRTNTLLRRIYVRLKTDGIIDGDVTGTPD